MRFLRIGSRPLLHQGNLTVTLRSRGIACGTPQCKYIIASRGREVDAVVILIKRYRHDKIPPLRGYVYRLFDVLGELIYIGSSLQPKRRILQHAYRQSWGHEISSWTITEYPTEIAARSQERLLIFAEQPKYNDKGVIRQMRIPQLSPSNPTNLGSERVIVRNSKGKLESRLW